MLLHNSIQTEVDLAPTARQPASPFMHFHAFLGRRSVHRSSASTSHILPGPGSDVEQRRPGTHRIMARLFGRMDE
jgi:hypothetical protein